MANLPDAIKEAWGNREGPAILTTVAKDGTPNSIYVGCVGLFDGKVVVADNYFDKTRANIKAGCKGAILFLTKDRKAFQVKGALEYHESGPVFDNMKTWAPEKYPRRAAAALVPEEAYSGAEKLL